MDYTKLKTWITKFSIFEQTCLKYQNTKIGLKKKGPTYKLIYLKKLIYLRSKRQNGKVKKKKKRTPAVVLKVTVCS